MCDPSRKNINYDPPFAGVILKSSKHKPIILEPIHWREKNKSPSSPLNEESKRGGGDLSYFAEEKGEKKRPTTMVRDVSSNGPMFSPSISLGVLAEVIEMAESKSLRKPVFTKVDQLRPGTSGHTLTVKVVSTKMVLQKGRADGPQVRQMRIAECLVGDETGMIIFTARNEQVDLMKEGATVTLRNAKIDMFKGSMRLAVDKWGRVEVDEPASFNVKEDNNLSLIEYELVNVVEE
ncbi:hypothetical protein PVK06_044552 [Gossypium arboreum]|uniref:Single-stranded DNA binding protein Ssb-like OB fold domain-containing protein n=14 Tax=Gossypium TaxID=3633 RepID=A0ABR0MRH3_GOSAR|nr:hypothetical protein PVK06_044552 [Gossypium arboreum]